MTVTVPAQALDTFEVSSDGTTVRLGFRSAEGQSVELVLPGNCIGPLAMTLPRIAKMVLQRSFGDPSLRLVFPVGHWSVEQAKDARTAILTIATTDGFEASYAMPFDALHAIGGLTPPATARSRAN